MVQKIIEVVGRSGKSFADAAKDAVAVAAKTVRGMRWARVSEFEMDLKDNKVVDYRPTVKIYFDVEKRSAAAGASPSASNPHEGHAGRPPELGTTGCELYPPC